MVSNIYCVCCFLLSLSSSVRVRVALASVLSSSVCIYFFCMFVVCLCKI